MEKSAHKTDSTSEDGYRGISGSPLDVAHVSPVDAGTIGKLLLTPALLKAKPL